MVLSRKSSFNSVTSYGDLGSEYGGGENPPKATAITVVVRKRPRILPREQLQNDVVRSGDNNNNNLNYDDLAGSGALGDDGEGGAVLPQSITVYAPKIRVDLTKAIEPTTFSFDRVFDENAPTESLYEITTKPLLETVRKGGSAVVFAFGQTGSGKTFTMLGDSSRDTPGIYSLAVRDLFAKLRGMKLTASFYEVYGQKLFDLLNERVEVRVLQDEFKNMNIVGLTERHVETHDELMELMTVGSQLRACGTTHANDRSSRSHAVLVLNLKTRREMAVFGRMTFVDLAGSERAADTTNTDKKTRREGAEINKSLLALKECIRAMGHKKKHVPFRGSKLTQILKESFVGNCTTCVIANVSPCHSHSEDTLNTLRYADRIKELKTNETDLAELAAPTPCANCGHPVFMGDRHICKKVYVQCPHCRTDVGKDKMDTHLQECAQRPMNCEHCSMRILQGDLPRHNKKCSRWPIQCLMCEEMVPRDLQGKHASMECPMVQVGCRFCKKQVMRKDLANHEERCKHQSVSCPHCTMPIKKGKLDAHVAECPSNRNRGKLAGSPSGAEFGHHRDLPGRTPLPSISSHLQQIHHTGGGAGGAAGYWKGRRASVSSAGPGRSTARGLVASQDTSPHAPVTARAPAANGRRSISNSQHLNVPGVGMGGGGGISSRSSATGSGAALSPSHHSAQQQQEPQTSRPRRGTNFSNGCKYCGRSMPPDSLDAHYRTDCPYAPVKCPFAANGCPSRGVVV